MPHGGVSRFAGIGDGDGGGTEIGARSKMIRMGAAVVGAFAAVPVVFVDAWSDLQSLDLSA